MIHAFSPSRLAAALALLLALVSGVAMAQVTNMDVNSDLPYTFLPPGARSAGMGGAFTALADDATAAYSNPAGLLSLSRAEVSMEVRHQRFTTPFANGPGSYGVAADGSLDSFPPYTGYESNSTGLSFLSYTYPRPAWSFGVFRTEVTRFSITARPEAIEGPVNFSEIAPRDIRADLLIEVFGAAAAWRATPKLWIGGAVTAQRMTYSAHQLDRRDPALNWGQRAEGRDTGPAGTVGVLWHPTESLRFGAAYRGGANLDASYSFTCGQRPPFGARPFICQRDDIPNGQTVPSLSGKTKFKVPDVWSVGVAYGLTETVTASVQYDHIAYSQLVDGLRNSLTVTSDPKGYRIDDADDIHFGIEALARRRSGGVLALRGGAWKESQHSLRYQGGLVAGPNAREQVAVALFSTPIGDEWHATAGIGYTSRGRLQLDLAADLSKYRDSYVLSTVIRF
jgi:long-chain fatty acid transport protein